jgi:hypothetical protein
MCSMYKLKKARQKFEWKTHFFDEGIIVKFSGNVIPVGVLIAITNNSCLCIFVPTTDYSNKHGCQNNTTRNE